MGEIKQKTKSTKHKKWLQWIIHVSGWLPLIFLMSAFFTNNLGFNPVEDVLRWTGRTAVVFLLLSLVCTPIHRIFVLPIIYRLRKPLGLYAALYAVLHFAAFAIWDYGLDFNLIWQEILDKPFLVYGLIALIILILLAATSFRTLRQTLGKAWVWLHRLVYAAGILIMIHILMAVKGDLSSLQGAYTAPLIASAILILLLLLRIPLIHQTLKYFVNRE